MANIYSDPFGRGDPADEPIDVRGPQPAAPPAAPFQQPRSLPGRQCALDRPDAASAPIGQRLCDGHAMPPGGTVGRERQQNVAADARHVAGVEGRPLSLAVHDGAGIGVRLPVDAGRSEGCNRTRFPARKLTCVFADDQIASDRHEAQTGADVQRRITETFSKAVEQLGSEKMEVRVGGIYTLERLARSKAPSSARRISKAPSSVGAHLERADLSGATGDAKTQLPDGEERPAGWPPYDDSGE